MNKVRWNPGMRTKTFKKGDRVKMTKATKQEFRRLGHLLPGDVAKGLDGAFRQIDDMPGEVVRVEPRAGLPDSVVVRFPGYHRPLDCSPQDLEKAG